MKCHWNQLTLTSNNNNNINLYAFCYSAYYHSSVLFRGPYLVFSQEGPQRGDPLGPLLFCYTIHPLLQSLEATSALASWMTYR